MKTLSPAARRELKARAHALHPVVSVGTNGLSASVLAEIDRSLKAHELIKVRVYGEERSEREALLTDICQQLDAAPVQHIGNILVIYRENPEVQPKPAAAAKPGKQPVPRPAAKTAAGNRTGTRATTRTGAKAAAPRRRLVKR